MSEAMSYAGAVWFLVAVVLALASTFYDGWTGNDDPAGGIILAALWPFCVVAAVTIGPIWIVYHLGAWCERLASRIRQALEAQSK